MVARYYGVLKLLHDGRDKQVAILQTTLSDGYSVMLKYEFRLNFIQICSRDPVYNIQHWFRKWLVVA